MPHDNFPIAVGTATAITLCLLTAGCTRDNSAPVSIEQIALQRPAVVSSEDLPEVVVTARRPRQETIAMSARDADAAANTSPTRANHQ